MSVGDPNGTAAHEHMPAGAHIVEADALDDLLAEARTLTLRLGEAHATQRGETRSLNAVVLVWRRPEGDARATGQWRPEDIAWYLDTFLAPTPANDPALPAMPGALVFPYTYAARTRFWDGGWGYLRALLAHARVTGTDLAAVATSRAAFEAFLASAGEALHLQTVLALCGLHGPRTLIHWQAHPDLLDETATAWRRDTLADAIADVAATPHSRRAVVAAMSYPHLEEQLSPRMGLPPYQLFQLLPGDADGPLHTIHVHRSLDVEGGAPLDFSHDLAWLREAAARTGRPVGTITVVAHNLHAYAAPQAEASATGETIAAWLRRVTDGYRTGEGTPARLATQPAYRANIARVWERWGR